jgi:hypothetical protein
MTQQELADYVYTNGCEHQKTIKSGAQLWTNPKNSNRVFIPMPNIGTHLKDTTVCLVCKTLAIPEPPHLTAESKRVNPIWDRHVNQHH